MSILNKIGKSIPVVGGFFDDSEEKAMEALERNRELYGQIALPQFNDYNPEEFQYLGDLKPEMMEYDQIEEDPMIRSDQMEVLAKLAGLSERGLSDVDAAGFERAKQLGARSARAGTEAAIENARARGAAGSGMEFAMREIANQEGANRAMNAGLEQAAEAARQRAAYTAAYGNSLAGMRNQDLNVNSQNTDIINRFNQMNTANRNDAAARNLDMRQGLSNTNIGERNAAQQYNNDLRQRSFDAQMAKTGGMAGANTGVAQGYAAQNAANAANRGANAQLGLSIYDRFKDKK